MIRAKRRLLLPDERQILFDPAKQEGKTNRLVCDARDIAHHQQNKRSPPFSARGVEHHAPAANPRQERRPKSDARSGFQIVGEKHCASIALEASYVVSEISSKLFQRELCKVLAGEFLT